MPRFTVDKRRRIEEKRLGLQAEEGEVPTDEDLEACLTRSDVYDLKMLRLAEVMVRGMQERITNTSDSAEQVAEAAVNSRKRRADHRINGQQEYAERKKKAQGEEARRENRKRLSEYRTEKLLTASVNDARNVGNMLGGMIQIIALNAGVSHDKVKEILGGGSTTNEPIPEPPEPELIILSDDDGCQNISVDEPQGNEEEDEEQDESDSDN